MNEIGSWTTAEGTVPATLDFESQSVDAQELPAWVKSAGTGALTGALTGAAAGPYGALAGAVAGGALGAAGSLSKPALSPSPPVAGASAPPPPASASPPPAPAPAATAGGASSATVATALQQLAAILPVLLQTIAASGAAAPRATSESFELDAEIGIDLEALEPSEWEFASLEGGWTVS